MRKTRCCCLLHFSVPTLSLFSDNVACLRGSKLSSAWPSSRNSIRSVRSTGEMIITGRKSKSRGTCSSDTLSTINTTCADPSLNPVVCDEKSANNDLDIETVTLLQCSRESLVSRTVLSDERAGLTFLRVSYVKLSCTNMCKTN